MTHHDLGLAEAALVERARARVGAEHRLRQTVRGRLSTEGGRNDAGEPRGCGQGARERRFRASSRSSFRTMGVRNHDARMRSCCRQDGAHDDRAAPKQPLGSIATIIAVGTPNLVECNHHDLRDRLVQTPLVLEPGPFCVELRERPPRDNNHDGAMV